jgi:serine/threonine protein kinase
VQDHSHRAKVAASPAVTASADPPVDLDPTASESPPTEGGDAAAAHGLTIGHIGRYALKQQLGEGGLGTVYAAYDPILSRTIAVKTLHLSVAEGDRTTLDALFLHEARAAAGLNHPNIVTVYDAGLSEQGVYIAMERLRGRDLRQLLANGWRPDIVQTAQIMRRVSDALSYAHAKGVIHCDIKPANILISGETDIKISDFGAALYDAAEHTHLKGVGSPAYMSPEQVQDRELDFHTDIYSLGALMYQMLTGKLPFRASSKASLLYQVVNIPPVPPSTFRRDIPADLDRVAMRCLEKAPEARYPTWSEFSRELTYSYRSLEVPTDTVSDTEKFSTLKTLSFFREFRDQELWEVVRIASWRKLLPDHCVIREGDSGESFFVIASGEAKVTKSGRLLNILRPGDCFGEMLYFAETNTRRSTTITSLSPLTVVEIKAANLGKGSDPLQKEMNKAFLRILIDRLTWANNRLSAA